ncbi:hypothetical protein Z043_112801, partial [Scleropages formosus]
KDTDENEVLLKSSLTGRQSPSFKLSFSSATKSSLTTSSSAGYHSGSPGSPGSPGSAGCPGSGPKSLHPLPAVTSKEGLVGLVDYPDDDEDDDDDMETKERNQALSKKAKLSS